MDHRRTKKRRTNLEHKRGKWEKDSILLDRDAEEYFRVAGITNMVERNAANRLIQKLKRLQIWHQLKRLYLFSPTSLAASAICAKTLTTATFVNAPSHSSAGVAFTAASAQYMDTGLVWNTTNFTFPSMHFAISASGIDTSISGHHYAGINGGSYEARVRQVGTTTKRADWRNTGGGGSLLASFTNVVATAFTALGHLRSTTASRAVRFDGLLVSSTAGTPVTGWTDSVVTMPVGCGVTTAGVYANFCTGTFRFFSVGGSFSNDNNPQLSAYWNAINSYNTALGR